MLKYYFTNNCPHKYFLKNVVVSPYVTLVTKKRMEHACLEMYRKSSLSQLNLYHSAIYLFVKTKCFLHVCFMLVVLSP